MSPKTKEVPNSIATFFHCKKCLHELPRGESPRSWAQLEVGVTRHGAIQVWCKRHETNVVILHSSKPPPGEA